MQGSSVVISVMHRTQMHTYAAHSKTNALKHLNRQNILVFAKKKKGLHETVITFQTCK